MISTILIIGPVLEPDEAVRDHVTTDRHGHSSDPLGFAGPKCHDLPGDFSVSFSSMRSGSSQPKEIGVFDSPEVERLDRTARNPYE